MLRWDLAESARFNLQDLSRLGTAKHQDFGLRDDAFGRFGAWNIAAEDCT